jgi:hypothetical protein
VGPRSGIRGRVERRGSVTVALTRMTAACLMQHCDERATNRVILVVEGTTSGVLLCPTHLAILHTLVADGYDIKIVSLRPIIPAQRTPAWMS